MYPPGWSLHCWSAKWCAPCQAMKKKKTLEGVASHLGLTLVYHDADKEIDLADKLLVTVLPTVDLVAPTPTDEASGAETPPEKRYSPTQVLMKRIEGAKSANAYLKALVFTP